MNKLENTFRENLLGQLSDEKTEVDVRVASKIARNFSVSFSLFCAENYTHNSDSNYWWNSFGVRYTTEELLKRFEDEI